MTALLPTNVSKTTMTSPNIPREKPTKATRRLPKNLQERQISMPGPIETADTEIGRPTLRYLGIALSRQSRSPAHCSYRMSNSTNETPPTPNSTAPAGQCKVPRKAEIFNKKRHRIRPNPNILSSDTTDTKRYPIPIPNTNRTR